MNFIKYTVIVLFMLSFQLCKPLDEKKPDIKNSPVDKHGMLAVSGTKIVNKNGDPVYLKGMSLYWSQWTGSFWNKEIIYYLVDEWKCAIVRAPMGITAGYLINPDEEKNKVFTVVDAALEKEVYVIIDWHDHDAIEHRKEAELFFREMAVRYKNTPNVIFEIFNEPDNESWSQVKKYSEAIIDIIRSEGADNIVIVGTPKWCQRVDLAADDPIVGQKNIVYALHFYAASHKEGVRSYAQKALSKGLPLIVSEWGTTLYTGDGVVDTQSSDTWIQFMKENSISWCNWSFYYKKETSSALKMSSPLNGPFNDEDLTASGLYIKNKITEQ